MASSIETGGAWSTMEDVLLCECWVQISHCPVTGSTCTEMPLSNRWKLFNKELGKWRDALAKVRGNHRSGENLSNEIMQAQMWFGAIG
ncbi:unnamed protein product [Prunus armeniaca]